VEDFVVDEKIELDVGEAGVTGEEEDCDEDAFGKGG
jgi:hypothetical protein